MGRWDGLNRRQFPRVNYPCLIVIREKEEDNVLLTHTENVGTGGICIILKQNLKMFSPVTLELDLLDLGDHIKCEGKVVWNVRRKMDAEKKPLFYDVGVEFGDLPEKDQTRLDSIIEKLTAANDKDSSNA
jgi:Tfp pilus assembly protein PilZ